jgi:hypothetical protein
MHLRISRARFLSLSLALLLPSAAQAQTPAGNSGWSDPPDGLMKKMMEALKTKSYDDFMIECDDNMRAALTKQMFDGVSNMMAPNLQSGHKITYLGKLRQKGHLTYLWKLEPPGGGKDETLIRMTTKDRKVTGFWLQ